MNEEDQIVVDLGEDGDSWLVTGMPTERAARFEVSKHLRAIHGENTTDYFDAMSALAFAVAEHGEWWFGTGHMEGEMIPVSKEKPPKSYTGYRFH